MQTDPLQQLRDVHMPADPSWWPPAPGWWLIAAAAIALLVWLTFKLLQAWQARAAIREARTLHLNNLARFQEGEIDEKRYTDITNELLKRLLVVAMGRTQLAPLSGQAWLEALDVSSDSDQFTAGPGSALGDIRYSKTPEVDVEGLHNVVTALLGKVKPAGAAW